MTLFFFLPDHENKKRLMADETFFFQPHFPRLILTSPRHRLVSSISCLIFISTIISFKPPFLLRSIHFSIAFFLIFTATRKWNIIFFTLVSVFPYVVRHAVFLYNSTASLKCFLEFWSVFLAAWKENIIFLGLVSVSPKIVHHAVFLLQSYRDPGVFLIEYFPYFPWFMAPGFLLDIMEDILRHPLVIWSRWRACDVSYCILHSLTDLLTPHGKLFIPNRREVYESSSSRFKAIGRLVLSWGRHGFRLGFHGVSAGSLLSLGASLDFKVKHRQHSALLYSTVKGCCSVVPGEEIAIHGSKLSFFVCLFLTHPSFRLWPYTFLFFC